MRCSERLAFADPGNAKGVARELLRGSSWSGPGTGSVVHRVVVFRGIDDVELLIELNVNR
jgi:hypothetical protein